MKRFGLLEKCAWLALGGVLPFCGCVAVNVGAPKAYTHTDTHFETASSPSATHVETARAEMNQTGTSLAVGIAADVQEEYPKLRWDETATVRVQNVSGSGFSPGRPKSISHRKGRCTRLFSAAGSAPACRMVCDRGCGAIPMPPTDRFGRCTKPPKATMW